MLKLHGLSTLAKIGKILLLVAIILDILAIGGFLLIGTGGMLTMMQMPIGVGILFYLLIVVVIIGLVVNILAYKAADENNFNRAGVMGLVSSFLPPLDIISLIAGIICLVSEEAKGD